MPISPPNIKSLPNKVDSDVRAAFQSIMNWFRAVDKSGGLVSQQDLAGAIADIPDISIPGFDGIAPPQLQNLTATGAFRTIQLQWDDPNDAHVSYVEIFRHTADVIGNAVKIGTTSSFMYPDTPPNASLSVTYYYWVRAVRAVDGEKVVGPFNATEGTAASTANDPAYVMQLISGELDKVTPSADVPNLVYAVNRFAVKNVAGGITKYPFIVDATNGVIMDVALIKDATITNAKIQNVATDKLYAGSALIGTALISDGAITNAKIGNYIQSTTYTPGSAGWKIDKSGTVEFNGGTFRGTVVFGSSSSGYANISDKPTSLSGINSGEATKLTGIEAGATVGATAAQASALGTAITKLNDWTRPGQTTIDGNKIYTGDAYVDTLQIKGQAVTVPIAVTITSDSWLWYNYNASMPAGDYDTGLSAVVVNNHSEAVEYVAAINYAFTPYYNNDGGASSGFSFVITDSGTVLPQLEPTLVPIDSGYGVICLSAAPDSWKCRLFQNFKITIAANSTKTIKLQIRAPFLYNSGYTNTGLLQKAGSSMTIIGCKR